MQPLQSLIQNDSNANAQADLDQQAAVQADQKAAASRAAADGLDATLNTVLLSAAVPGNRVQLDGTQKVFEGVPGATKPHVSTVPLASTITYDDGVPPPAPTPAPATDPNAPQPQPATPPANPQ